MPFVVNQGARIHYEVEGRGPALVLHHGMALSLESWRQYGYVAALREDFRLVLLDARGHGASDRPPEAAAYGADLMAGDVLAVLDELGIERAVYYGYSMGSRVGFQLARCALPRVRSFILGGMSPFFAEAEQRHAALLRQSAAKGMEGFAYVLERMAGPTLLPETKAIILANDGEVIQTLREAIQRWPSPEPVLPAITVPCLLYAGDADPLHGGAEQCARQLANATFFSLPGLNHMLAFTRSDLVIPRLREFLSTIV